MKEFGDTLSAAYNKYLSGYGEKQIHLWLLTTHPDFRRRGAGTMLCNWGIDRAAEKGWVVTVLASPLGKLLYEYLGCKLLGSVTVRVDEEKEKLLVFCLVHLESEKHSE